MKKHITAFTMILVFLLGAYALAEDISARVNIALEDGTIMIYAGGGKGINPGDEFEVTRGAQRVGLIRVTQVKDLFSYCEIVEGEAQEMDTVTRVKAAPPAAPAAEKKTAEKKKPETMETEETPPAEAPAEGKSTRSTRREKAADEKKTSGEAAPAEPETAKKTTPEKPAPGAEKPGMKTRGLPPIGSLQTAALGLTGCLFMPSGNIAPASRGTALLYYANASDKTLDYKDTGIGVNFGLGGDLETSYMYLSTKFGSGGGATAGSQNANVFSFKYQLKNTSVPSFLDRFANEARYAAGFQYFGQGESESPANRFFVVATGKYNEMYGHFGLYYQSGEDIVDDYEGIGYMGAIEYPFNRGTGSALEQMAAVLEYDDKALYLGTLRTLSIGFRYSFSELGTAGLYMADLGSTNTLVFKGAYNF